LTSRTPVEGPIALHELALIATAQVLALSTWFAASAAGPALRAEWRLSGSQVPLLTSAVQVGFVVGALTSAALMLPDRLHPPRLMACSAFGAAACTALFSVLAHGLVVAVPLRFLTGACLAGVYPVGLKLASSWFLERRGFALGVLVGALTLGSTLPQLIGGSLGGAWRVALVITAGLCATAGLLAARTKVGPHVAPPSRLQPGIVVGLLRRRGPRLANLGYFGHMWELYAMWTWVPAYLAASAEAAGTPVSDAVRGIVTFVALGVFGVLGCLLGGRLGDRWGRARVAAAAMLGSGTCCLLAATLYGGPLALLLPVLAVWGATVIADSALFSACTTSVVHPAYTGTALTFQTAVGFLVTVVTIQGMPVVVQAAGWPVAVACLAVGPLLGAIAMLRLSPLLRESTRTTVTTP
jgi:MFS family permease